MDIFDEKFFEYEPANEGLIKDIKETYETNQYNKINIPKIRNQTKMVIHKASFNGMDARQRDLLWYNMISYLYKNKLLLFVQKSFYEKCIDLRNYDFYGLRVQSDDARAKSKDNVIKFLKSCKPSNYTNAKDFMTDLKAVKL